MKCWKRNKQTSKEISPGSIDNLKDILGPIFMLSINLENKKKVQYNTWGNEK